MGLLVQGEWKQQWYDTKSTQGEFVRQKSQFRNWIEHDAQAEFPAEKGRYHLYVSYACPWAHRALIFRKLKKLEEIVSVSVVDPLMLDNGWEFSENKDFINQKKYLYQVYLLADPNFTGRVTVPVLWDKKKRTIVNNESSEIIRIFNSSFLGLTEETQDYYPKAHQKEIDEINAYVYENINNGVYRCGFATTQKAYEKAYHSLFDALDRIESILQERPFLVGENVTEADWRLFTTLVRFDAVYVGHFKCNKKRIADYPKLTEYINRLYNWPSVKETVNFEHIKSHYYRSHPAINPTGIVALGPELDWE